LSDVVEVSDEYEVVDGVEADEAEMMDTIWILDKAPGSGGERMERRRCRAARPTTMMRCTTMSWR
jgi:hypothetical protein